MDVDTIRTLCAVHCDEIEINWVKYDRRRASSAHVVIHARSVSEFLDQLKRVIGQGEVEVMEGTAKFYAWCKLPDER